MASNDLFILCPKCGKPSPTDWSNCVACSEPLPSPTHSYRSAFAYVPSAPRESIQEPEPLDPVINITINLEQTPDSQPTDPDWNNPNLRSVIIALMGLGLPLMLIPYPPLTYLGAAMMTICVVGGMANWGHWYD